LGTPQIVFGELSVTNKWRIEQATLRCTESNNAIRYQEYWQDSVSDENEEVVCMAEQVADLIVTEEADEWLEKKAIELIESCKNDAKRDMRIYFLCLQKNLDRNTRIVSSPCKEFGREQLWDQEQCSRLVSFIFMKRFEGVLEENKPQIQKVHTSIDKIKDVKVVRTVFNPIIAIIFFYLLALAIVFLIDRGNWMRVSRWGFVTGPFIVISCFFSGGWRFFLAGIAIITLIVLVLWNRRKTIVELIKKTREKVKI
jgi:hypothetical protein